MNRTRIAATVAAAAVLALTATGTASAAAPSSQDQTFMVGSDQTNLAEITIGGITTSRSTDQAALALANMTVADHQTAQGKLTALAKTKGVTLPATPNAAQQADAAKLKAVDASTYDVTYAQVQVAGHQKALADTDKELTTGTDPDVKAYATATRPVVAMHLQMSQDLLANLGGTPAGVPAGTGGQAGTGHSTNWAGTVGVAALGLLAMAVIAVITRRRTSANR